MKLAEFAATQPQACYAAYRFGLKHNWTYYLRTLFDIEELLEPRERAISDALMTSITGHTSTTSERELLALPVRKRERGLENPVEQAGFEHAMSLQVTAPFVAQIISQAHEPPDDILKIIAGIHSRKCIDTYRSLSGPSHFFKVSVNENFSTLFDFVFFRFLA